ncbi:hypothetical protein [Terriglobus sp.]|uniref:hypothetical protein n=1 Tax=Terriglobus sp. TaxID=1889013 RepID=UPI003AFF8067
MAEDLIQFWRRYQWRAGELGVHPEDRAWMEQHWPAPLREPYLDWPAYLKSSRFGSKDTDVHLSHLPAPFWGDLDRARVLLFLKNPGFDNTDYYLESQPDFREAHLHGLRSPAEPFPFPFIHLDPRFSWSGSFLWWEQRLRPILDALTAENGLTYQEALHILANQIAAVQLFPYRSRDSSRLRYQTRAGGTMPSVAAAQRFLTERAHAAVNANAAANASTHKPSSANQQLILLMRSHAGWITDACPAPDHRNYIHGPRLQGVSLHPRFPAGKRLLKVIRQSLHEKTKQQLITDSPSHRKRPPIEL